VKTLGDALCELHVATVGFVSGIAATHPKFCKCSVCFVAMGVLPAADLAERKEQQP
jgi:hypothetical protein